jgi:hypothetical protein
MRAMSEGFNRAAQARRLFMHVENGGQLKPYNVAGMVRAIEELETECHTLLAERDELRQALEQARFETLDAANEYMTEQYGIGALGNHIDRARVFAALQSTTTKEEE